MQINKNTIKQFLTLNSTCFMIPVYQRNYDWQEDNCKQLWNDLMTKTGPNKTHFIGSVCLKTANSYEKTIIDGQQRLTTVTLLMKAMHDCVSNEEFKEDIDKTFLRNLNFGVTENHKVKLHLNRRDDRIYNRMLEFNEFIKEENLTKEEKESRLYKNYCFFYNKINGLEDEQLVSIRDALDKLVIVDIDVENENPQEIFESLNSTGVDLTDVDLLRNYLLMSLDYETQVRLFNDYWYKIEENAKQINMVRFFIDYLIYVRKSDSVVINGRKAHINDRTLYLSFKNHYETLSNTNKDEQKIDEIIELVLKDMYEISKIYKYLVFENDIDMNKMNDINRILYSIIVLNESPRARPLLLFIMKRYIDEIDEEETTLKMLNACLSLTVRSKVTRTKGIDGQFSGTVLQKLIDVQDDTIIDDFWAAITSGNGRYVFPTNQMFREALLNRPIYETLRSKGCKYLLYALEQDIVESKKGLPRYDSNNISVEHIMPITLSEEWKEYLGEDEKNHDNYLNRLGNLALTSNNSEMSNKVFSKKQDWYEASSFSLTRELKSEKQWNSKNIKTRGKQLTEKCVKLFAYPEKYSKIAAENKNKDKREAFKFSLIGLVEGDEVTYIKDENIIAVIVDDNHVLYNGKKYSLSGLAQELSGTSAKQGPKYFLYDGENLDDLRREIEANLF